LIFEWSPMACWCRILCSISSTVLSGDMSKCGSYVIFWDRKFKVDIHPDELELQKGPTLLYSTSSICRIVVSSLLKTMGQHRTARL
jgi:hypothetical protein